MKKSIIFFVLTFILISFAAAQVYPPSQGTVVTSGLTEFLIGALAALTYLFKYLLIGGAYAFDFSTSQTAAILFAFLIWGTMLWKMVETLEIFSAFSTPAAWLISLGIMVLITLFGIVKILALALSTLVLMFTTSTGIVIAIGIMVLLLIFIIWTVIMNMFSSAVKKRKEEEKEAKVEVGKKALEKIGKEFGK